MGRSVVQLILVGLILLLVASLATESTSNPSNLNILSGPPALPSTIYGNVTITCQTNQTEVEAPSGLYVRAYYPNGTLAAETQTGGDTGNSYALSIPGSYSGDIDIYVENVYILTVTVQSGSVIHQDLVVNEAEPPTAPGSISVEPKYDPNPTITWEESEDNLGIKEYKVTLYYEGSLLYSDSVTTNEWSPPSPLNDGNYTIEVSAVDLSCNQGPLSSLIFVVDTQTPSLVDINPTNNSILNTSSLKINITVEEHLTGVLASATVDGNTANTTVQYLGEGYWKITVQSNGLQDGQHRVNITVSDEAGNSFLEELVYTIDTNRPIITQATGPNNIWINTNSVEFTFYIIDNISGVNWDSVRVTLDESDVAFDINPNEGYVNITLSSLSEGNHTLKITVSDNAGNMAIESINFGIDLTPPIIQIHEPVEGYYYNTSTLEINISISDTLSGINSSSIQLFLDGQAVTSFTYTGEYITATLSGISDGFHTITVLVADKASNEISDQVNFTIDTISPELSIISPADGAYYNTQNIQLTLTASDNIELLTADIYIDGNLYKQLDLTGQQTFSYNESVQLSEGQHTVIVIVSDIAGNRASLDISFVIDTTPPQINIVSPVDDAYYASYSILVNLTVTDNVGLLNVTIFLDDQVLDQAYMTGTSYSYVDTVMLNDGTHKLKVVTVDLAGNSKSKEITFTIDTGTPSIIIRSPQDSVYYNSTSISLNITASDSTGLDIVEIYLDDELIAHCNCSGNTSWSYSTVLTDLAEGLHSLKVTAVDVSNNSKDVIIEFVVDVTPPTIAWIYPGTGLSYINSSQLCVSAEVSDNILLDVDRLKLLVDGSSVEYQFNASTEIITSCIELIDGWHNITIVAYDAAGNEARSQIIVVVDTLEPVINVTSPLQQIYNETTLEFDIEISDNIGLLNVTIILDNNLINTSNNAGITYHYNKIHTLTEGRHTLTVIAKDYAGNRNVYTIEFVVDITPPDVNLSISPEDTYINSSTITIHLSAQDNFAMQTANIYVDNILQYTFDLAGETQWNYTLRINLTEGNHNISITVIDKAGNSATASTALTIDITPPSIQILQPANGSIYNQSNIIIAAKLNDSLSGINASTITVAVDGAPILNFTYYENNGTLIATVRLIDGEHHVEISAEDNAGNVARAFAAFYIDTGLPKILVYSPIEGAIYNSSTVTLNMTVIDPTGLKRVVILVDGATHYSCNCNGTSAWNYTSLLSLTNGLHTILVSATDITNKTNTTVVTITIDTISPLVEVTPQTGIFNYTVLEMFVKISDNTSGLAYLMIYVDGNLYQEYDLSGQLQVGTNISILLTEGAHNITWKVADLAGNIMELTTGPYIIDLTPPLVVSFDPANGTVIDAVIVEQINITVIVEEPLSGLAQAYIFVNNTQINTTITKINSSTYRITGSIQTQIIPAGPSTIYFQAIDNAGNIIRYTSTILVDKYPPSITIISPKPTIPGKYITNKTVVNISAVIEDPDLGIEQAYLLVNDSIVNSTLNGSVLSATILLPEGIYNVSVVAVDVSGKKTISSMIVIVDLTAPIITIEGVSNNTLVNSTFINITVMSVDNFYIDNIQVLEDGQQLPISLIRINETSITVTATLNFTQAGSHNITIKASDIAGNIRTRVIVAYADWQAPVIEAPLQVISNSTNITIKIYAYDDTITALISNPSKYINVIGPFNIAAWYINGTLVLSQDKDMPELTPIPVEIVITDLAGRKANTIIYVVKGTPTNITITTLPGWNLLAIPQGVIPQVLEQLISKCGNMYYIAPNWTLSKKPVSTSWIPVAINASSTCTLNITGYVVPLSSNFRLYISGETGILVPALRMNLTEIGLPSETLVYLLNTTTSKWEISYVISGRSIGKFTEVIPGNIYLIYNKYPSNLAPNTFESGPTKIKPSPSGQDTMGDHIDDKGSNINEVLVGMAGFSSLALATRKRKIAYITAGIFLLLLISLTSFVSLSQEVIITKTPESKIEIIYGNYAVLQFNATINNSYQSIIIIRIKVPDGLELTNISIIQEGILQKYEIERINNTTIIIQNQSLSPPNGNLTVQLELVPLEIGNYNVSWRIDIGATSQLLPVPPQTAIGNTTIIVIAASTTTQETSSTTTIETTTTPIISSTTTTTPTETSTTSPLFNTTSNATGTTTTTKESIHTRIPSVAIVAVILVLILGVYLFRRGETTK